MSGGNGMASARLNTIELAGDVAKRAPTPHRVAPRVADANVLEEVIEQLNVIDRGMGIERTLAIGDLILNRFFGGDPAAWRDRRRNKNNSVRRLAERDDCPFCRSALNDAVAVCVATKGLPCVRTFGHVYASHIAAVLQLPVEDRERWLKDAEKERWSVRELRRRVTEFRRSEGERRGRPPIRIDLRSITGLRTLVRKVDSVISRMEIDCSGSDDLRVGLRALAADLDQSRARLTRLACVRPDNQPDSHADPVVANRYSFRGMGQQARRMR